MTGGKVALIAMGIVALGAVGYFGNHELTCRSYEDQYLNGISDAAGGSAIRRIADTDSDAHALGDQIYAEGWDDAEKALLELSRRCGSERADTAHRRGNELIMDLY